MKNASKWKDGVSAKDMGKHFRGWEAKPISKYAEQRQVRGAYSVEVLWKYETRPCAHSVTGMIPNWAIVSREISREEATQAWVK